MFKWFNGRKRGVLMDIESEGKEIPFGEPTDICYGFKMPAELLKEKVVDMDKGELQCRMDNEKLLMQKSIIEYIKYSRMLKRDSAEVSNDIHNAVLQAEKLWSEDES